MVKFFISFVVLQVGISFGAAASSCAEGSPAASVSPAEQIYTPLEQCALSALNSAHALFGDNKTFRMIDDARNTQFLRDFMAVTDVVARFSVIKGLMNEGYIDGFDRALVCLQKANSTLAQYMAPLCILARAQGEKAKYQLPECSVRYVLEALCPNNRLQFDQAVRFPREELPIIFSNLVSVLDNNKRVIKALSPYFAYCMNIDSNQFSATAIKYAKCLLQDQLIHKADGTVFVDDQAAKEFGALILYNQILLYRKLSPKKRPEEKERYDMGIYNLAWAIDHKKLRKNPNTGSPFSFNGDQYEFLGKVLGQDVSLFPKLAAYLEPDPVKRIHIFCSTVDTLQSDELVFLSQEIQNTGHVDIAKKAAEFFNKPIKTITILEQQAFLLKKAYDCDQSNDMALVRLCFNCMQGGDAFLLPAFNGHKGLTIIRSLIGIVKRKKSDQDFYDALYLLKGFRDQLGYGLGEVTEILINEKTSADDDLYPNLYRMEDAKELIKNTKFPDLAYLERLLGCVIDDPKLGIQACQMLYDLSLKIGDMGRASKYADKLYQKTTHETKTAWGKVHNELKYFLNPPKKENQSNVSPEDEEKARGLLAQEQARKKDERQRWIQQQLEQRRLYKQERPEEEVKSILNLDHMPRPQFEIKEEVRVTGDLQKFGTLGALRANYDKTIGDLKVGRKPSDNSKFVGTTVSIDGKQFALWHCRLNNEHRVFYYKIGTDVYVIQAFGHDLDKSRLPS